MKNTFTYPTIETPNGKINKGDRVWIIDKFGLRAGEVDLTGVWRCNPGKADEHYTPYFRVRYDEIFKPFDISGRWDEYFWRPDELTKVHPQEFVSACCGAPIIAYDQKGHGKCKRCKENATPAEPEILTI